MKKRVLTILSIVAMIIMASAAIALAEDTGFTAPKDGDIVQVGSNVDVTYVMGYTPANAQPCIKITIENPSGEAIEHEVFDIYETTTSFTADTVGTYKITGTCGQYITMNMGLSSTKFRSYSDENERVINVKVLSKEAYQKQTANNEAAVAAEAKAKKVKTVTVNVKTVNKKAIDKAVKKKGGSKNYVTKIVLGKKVKKISKNAFKTYKKVKTLEVKSKKLTKKSVKNALKGSKIKTVKVNVAKKNATNKKYVKKYKKIFTKKNAGKKVTVK